MGDTTYDGLPIRCAPGVHEKVFALLNRHANERTGLLDIAAGSGALLARLRDSGWTDLSAIELDAPKFQLPGIAPLPLDLNDDFASHLGRTFRAVTAIEIVEHLDSPVHFLKQVHALLEGGGLLAISTPNIASWIGRVKFFLTGTLRYFDERQYRHNHHISPVPAVLMRLLLKETGFELIESATAGNYFGPMKRVILWPVDLLMWGMMGETARGDVCIWIARRVEAPPLQRPGDWTR